MMLDDDDVIEVRIPTEDGEATIRAPYPCTDSAFALGLGGLLGQECSYLMELYERDPDAARTQVRKRLRRNRDDWAVLEPEVARAIEEAEELDARFGGCGSDRP